MVNTRSIQRSGSDETKLEMFIFAFALSKMVLNFGLKTGTESLLQTQASELEIFPI